MKRRSFFQAIAAALGMGVAAAKVALPAAAPKALSPPINPALALDWVCAQLREALVNRRPLPFGVVARFREIIVVHGGNCTAFANPIDITAHVASDGWRHFIPGPIQWSLDCEPFGARLIEAAKDHYLVIQLEVRC